MKNGYSTGWKLRSLFTALVLLSVLGAKAQPTHARPIIKYAINNFSSIQQAACDTCDPIVGKPLQRYRPIPFPLTAAINFIPGVDINVIPGIAAPNFLGGGSPEIKGLVKEVAGMKDWYAERVRKTDILYFRSGAEGVAISSTGKIITSSSTILPGVPFNDQNLKQGFFSFESSPARLPTFNDRSEELFLQSPDKVVVDDVEVPNVNKEIGHFALDPNDDDIVYAAFQNTEDDTKILARKNPDTGKWEVLDWDIPDGLDEPVWGPLTVDDDGNLYVADPIHHVIVKVQFDDDGKADSWQIIGGKWNTSGLVNDEDGLDARFNKPSGMCFDEDGNMYIGDAGNNVIRKIDNDGEVTTYAGSGSTGFTDDDDPTKAKFEGPTAVAYNEVTQTLYVIDYKNKLVREINTARNVSTLAGNAGTAHPIADAPSFAMNFYYVLAQLNMDPDEAKFDDPTGIAIDPSGLGLYVSDGKYIKYVNTFKAVFRVTSSIRDTNTTNPLYGLPVLPPGIFINPNNGSFFGASTLPWEPTTYTISATNHLGGSLVNGFITFEVVDCPKIPDTVRINTSISPRQLPYHWNGQVLNGSDTAMVTLQSSGGCDSVVILHLLVKVELKYNCEPYMLSLGQLISPITPTTDGSTIDLFSVSPPLPAGLTLNTQTGVITGTPTAYATSQLFAAIGPNTPQQYAAPWYLEADKGADLTQVQILDCNGATYFENNSGFKSLQGSAGAGVGRAGAYTDFSGLGPIQMSTNTPYSIRLSNTLSSPSVSSLNQSLGFYNFMNSYAVFIDYNRDGDFGDAGERVYKSASPQSGAHAELFNLNIPVTATSGVTKMRIYAVEAKTMSTSYIFRDPSLGIANQVYWIDRTTEQALSFYPYFEDISNFSATSGPNAFYTDLDYGEFEDYNIDIENPHTQSYVIKGRNNVDSAEAIVKISVTNPTASTTNATICSTQLPYTWNTLVFTQAGTQTDTLKNRFGADSLATLNLVVKQATQSEIWVAHCGTYYLHGQAMGATGVYPVKISNAVGCDSTIYVHFRQKATESETHITLIPSQLPYLWNGISINLARNYSATLPNSENCDSVATLWVRVEYNIYYPDTIALQINQPMAPVTPVIEGNYTPNGWGYTISPALPAGLQFSYANGTISGTPTQLSPLRTYTMTLQQDGAIPSTFKLGVGMPTTSTTTINNCGPYTWNGTVYQTSTTATFVSKNQYGFDSTATLLLTVRNLSASTSNLFVNYADLPLIWNGDSITTEGLHTVVLVNAAGCDSAATANVVISPRIFYVTPQILRPAQPIVPIVPQSVGGRVLNYTITPSLVAGLGFNATTGTITGTPMDTLVEPVRHTVLAINGAGADTVELVIAVCNPMATSFSRDVCDRFVWNDSAYTESTTHIRTLKNRGGCDSVVTMNLIVRKATFGRTDVVTACGNYVWYGVNYDSTGVYTKVYRNAVECDSTIYLNLTIKKLTVNHLYVNLNASDFPYTWRGKTFTAPGTDTVMKVNSVGCDSTVYMTVRISELLPDIGYAMRDTVLYWENRIETPIAMSNTGTPIPVLKLGERDTLIRFANPGPGDYIRSTVKAPNGVYYGRVDNGRKVYKLSPTGVWSEFADPGAVFTSMAIDTAGNLYVGLNTIPGAVKMITPAGVVSFFEGLPRWTDGDALAVDADNNLIVLSQDTRNLFTLTKIDLATKAYTQRQLDNNPYFDYAPEDMKVDSKGNIYIYKNAGNNVVKIKPNGHMSGIGRTYSSYSDFTPGNGIDAMIPEIQSMAIDATNDNVYLMAYRRLLRIDTALNVTAITGRWFDLGTDQIFRVDSGKVSIVNNPKAILYTANVYGVGSMPFMDNYGDFRTLYEQNGTVNYTDFDQRIRLDSSGAIVGTPRTRYSSVGTIYAYNRTTGYTVIGANHHGISTAPMAITVKTIYYKRESFVTTTLPFVWRGRSYSAATDTARYLVRNLTDASDTMYMLHLVYEGAPEPYITSVRNCAEGKVTLTANGAAKEAIRFDGTNRGLIKNVHTGGGGSMAYWNINFYTPPGGGSRGNPHASFEVWIKPASVSGIQYLLTRDTVKTHGTFFGYSIQDGKFVYEFTKGQPLPGVDYKLSSVSNIEPNVWTHVAASYYDSTMHIFVNGQLEGTRLTAENFINPFYFLPDGVGIYPDFHLAGLGSQMGYKGEMDELRLWGKRRNADSIKATMHSIVHPSSPGLGLYYRFDGDAPDGARDVTAGNRTAAFVKPAVSVPLSGAPIRYASYNWTPGGDTAKTISVNGATNALYTLTVTDYKGATGRDTLTVFAIVKPAKVNCWDNYVLDTTACTWVNIGTQPVKPSMECYQSATFNTVTCKWDVVGKPINAGTNGTLALCEGTPLTAPQLFASLGGNPTAGGVWSPALAGAGTYTYTVTAKAPCTGSASSTVTVTTILKTIQAGCFSATIDRVYNATTNRTTFSYAVCANNCPHALGYVAFITQTNIPVIAPSDGSNYNTPKRSYKVSVPVGTENGNRVWGVKFETKGEGIKKAGECDNFVFTLAGNISKDAITVRFKAGNQVTNTTATCPSGATRTSQYVQTGAIEEDVIDKVITSAHGVEADKPSPGTEKVVVSGLVVKAYPNPYMSRVTFEVVSPEAGEGSLELFNLLGQKVKTLYQGKIVKGVQTFVFTVPDGLQSTLIYRCFVNGKQVTGKLLHVSDGTEVR